MANKHSRSVRLLAQRVVNTAPTVPSAATDPPGDPNDTVYTLTGQDPDSDPITPPLVTAKPLRRSQPTAIELSDGSDSEPLAKKRKAKKAKEPVVLDPDHKLVLMIPQASNEGTQPENLKHSTLFSDTLEVIYDTIGCAKVPRKPLLSYKLSTAAAKAPNINPGSDANWEGCLEEVTDVEGDKKKVQVIIVVADQYMDSLRVKLGHKKTGTSTKGRGKRLPVLDLEHTGSGDDDFDEGLGIMEKEMKFLEQLQNHHGRCQVCGPSKACKIDRGANHHHLTNNQLRGWSCSLAAGTYSVTLAQPPRDELFAMFHKELPSAPTRAAAPVAPFAGMEQFMAMNPYGFATPWGAAPFGQGHSLFPGTPITPSPVPRASLRLRLLVPVVAALFDVAVDYAIGGNGREKGVPGE
ncbi:hypothetical protein C8R43DRAFT_1143200 [Mycena crocata]|nr:hypothetical protein C8R43DRAFT_1143200 [Mycena crocata]